MSEHTNIEWCDSTCTGCGVTLTSENRSEKGRRRCKSCRNAAQRAAYTPKGKPERSGPLPSDPRSGDKKQARQRINVLVRTGRLPHPNTLPCADCGHAWRAGERRHEYDHHKGYAAEHHYDVEAVCTTCHAARDSTRKAQTHCVRGHEFTPENTFTAKNGTRHCKECRREHDRKRGSRRG